MVIEDLSVKVKRQEFVISPSSGALVKCGRELIMMKRDDNPNIPHPGKIALLGGGVIFPETVNEALIRELKDEIGIIINESQINNLGILKGGDDNDHIKYISLVELTDEQGASIQKGKEGESIVYFNSDNLPEEKKLVPDLKVIFINNRECLVNWLKGESVEPSDVGLKTINKT